MYDRVTAAQNREHADEPLSLYFIIYTADKPLPLCCCAAVLGGAVLLPTGVLGGGLPQREGTGPHGSTTTHSEMECMNTEMRNACERRDLSVTSPSPHRDATCQPSADLPLAKGLERVAQSDGQPAHLYPTADGAPQVLLDDDGGVPAKQLREGGTLVRGAGCRGSSC